MSNDYTIDASVIKQRVVQLTKQNEIKNFVDYSSDRPLVADKDNQKMLFTGTATTNHFTKLELSKTRMVLLSEHPTHVSRVVDMKNGELFTTEFTLTSMSVVNIHNVLAIDENNFFILCGNNANGYLVGEIVKVTIGEDGAISLKKHVGIGTAFQFFNTGNTVTYAKLHLLDKKQQIYMLIGAYPSNNSSICLMNIVQFDATKNDFVLLRKTDQYNHSYEAVEDTFVLKERNSNTFTIFYLNKYYYPEGSGDHLYVRAHSIDLSSLDCVIDTKEPFIVCMFGYFANPIVNRFSISGGLNGGRSFYSLLNEYEAIISVIGYRGTTVNVRIDNSTGYSLEHMRHNGTRAETFPLTYNINNIGAKNASSCLLSDTSVLSVFGISNTVSASPYFGIGIMRVDLLSSRISSSPIGSTYAFLMPDTPSIQTQSATVKLFEENGNKKIFVGWTYGGGNGINAYNYYYNLFDVDDDFLQIGIPVGILTNEDKLVNEGYVDGFEDLTIGSNVYYDKEGKITQIPTSNTYIGVAVSKDRIKLTKSIVDVEV